MELFDTHSHVQFPGYDDDRAEVLARARAAGVRTMAAVGIDRPSSEAAVALALAEDDVWATVGVHPHEADDHTDGDLDRVCAMAERPRVVAIGETGLDHFKGRSDPQRQRQAFRRQAEWAARLGLPVIVHCRDALDEVCEILHAVADEEGGAEPPPAPEGSPPRRAWNGGIRGVLHCFTPVPDDVAGARSLLDRGMHYSLSGIVSFPNADDLRAAVRDLGPERMCVETDCPFLAPQSRRGDRNEPAFTVEVAEAAGAVHGLDLEQTATLTTRNARRLFGLDADPQGGTP